MAIATMVLLASMAGVAAAAPGAADMSDGMRVARAEYRQGFNEGKSQAMREKATPAFTMGLGTGFAVGGTGVALVGALGAPCMALGCTVPMAAARMGKVEPPPGPWMDESQSYRNGYVRGYSGTYRDRRTAAALSGGALGVGLGSLVALGVVAVVANEQGEIDLW